MTFRRAAPIAMAALITAGSATAVLARPQSGSSASETGDQAYVTATQQNDLFAITEGRMAARRARSAALRAYAAKSAQAHAADMQAVQRAAKAGSVVTPPPTLSGEQRQLVRQLQAASPASFGRIYLEQARDLNTQSIALQRGFSQGGGDAGLRRVASRLADAADSTTAELQALEP
ncbi:MAG: DUF4142 domain-containing protein [Caulobacteraceae bacterium]|nr:DUF4142 domain-containing protein [Caulobacter sp.]